MPRRLMVCGRANGRTYDHTVSRWEPLAGALVAGTAENARQTRIRADLLLSDLFVRVTANAIGSPCTVRSRVNGANGNQAASIGSGSTGTFEDAVNSDVLADGDLANTVVQTGVSGHGDQITISILSYILGTGDSSLTICDGLFTNLSDTTSFVNMHAGLLSPHTVEVDAQYRFRHAGTFSRMRIWVSDNGITVASTFRTRVNSANGNQSVSITASTTGEFEDTTNEDAFVSGDLICYQIVIGVSMMGTDTQTMTLVHMRAESVGYIVAAGTNGGPTFAFGTSTFISVEQATANLSSTESDAQVDARVGFQARNYYVRSDSNTFDAATTVLLRQNGADTVLSVSVSAGVSGEFEDTTDQITVVPTDALNHEVDATASTVGVLELVFVGFEMEVDDMPHDESWVPSIQRVVSMRAY